MYAYNGSVKNSHTRKRQAAIGQLETITTHHSSMTVVTTIVLAKGTYLELEIHDYLLPYMQQHTAKAYLWFQPP